MLKKVAVLFSLMMAFSIQSFGQAGVTAVPFLQIAPDSRSSGFGEGGVAMSGRDPNTIFWNPAALYRVEEIMVAITHANWLPQLTGDLFYDYLAVTYPLGEDLGTLGMHVTYLNLGENVRTSETNQELGRFFSWEGAVGISYGVPINVDWSFGTGARFIYSRLSPVPTAGERGEGIASGFGVDLATEWHPQDLMIDAIGMDFSKKFRLGVSLSNIGPKMTYIDEDQADPLPTNFRAGVAYKWFDDEYYSLETFAEFSKLMVSKEDSVTSYPVYQAIYKAWYKDGVGEEFKKANYTIGGEFVYDKFFFLRMGYFHEDEKYGNRKFMTYGVGLVYSFLNFDFSYISAFEEAHPLEGTVRISLGLNVDRL